MEAVRIAFIHQVRSKARSILAQWSFCSVKTVLQETSFPQGQHRHASRFTGLGKSKLFGVATLRDAKEVDLSRRQKHIPHPAII